MANCQQCQTHPAAVISGVGYCVAHLALAAPAPKATNRTNPTATVLRRVRVTTGKQVA